MKKNQQQYNISKETSNGIGVNRISDFTDGGEFVGRWKSETLESRLWVFSEFTGLPSMESNSYQNEEAINRNK
jgi:hypothetical protein